MNKLLKALLAFVGVAALAILFYNQTSNNDAAILERYEHQSLLASKHDGLSPEALKKLPKRDRPDLAFLQEFEMTKDPALGYPPVRRKLEAFKTVQKMNAEKASQRAAIPNVEWVERGPNNIAGRTRSLMFDPNDNTAKKVWAGAIGGGLWYTTDITDEAVKWQPVDDLMSNLAISTLAYDPSNTQVYYMGTGLGYTSDLQGQGIWKSSDAGATWSQLTSTDNTDFQFVQKIKVTSTGAVLANTFTGTHRSTDGGATWTIVNSPGRMGDIEIASDGAIYSSEGTNVGVGSLHKSIDDGLTWTDITPAGGASRIEITVAPSDPNRIYALGSSTGFTTVAWFMRSDDGGTNWQNITIPRYTSQSCTEDSQDFTRGQAFFDLISLVHSEDPDVLLVGGIDIHRSTDGGSSWELVSYWTGRCDVYVHADQHEMIHRPGYPNEAIFGNDGGVSYSPDIFKRGNNPNFLTRNNGYNVTTFYATAIVNEVNSNHIIAGAQDNGTLLLNDVGIGSAFEATGGDGAFCFIDQDNPDIQISSFVYNSYRLSQDRGNSFVSISNDQDKGRFINPSEYDSNTDILYGAGDGNEISKIENLSTAASALAYITVELGGSQISAITASPYTENRLFVGLGGSPGNLIYMIDNANTLNPTTTNITGTFNGNSSGIYVSSIDVGASDDQLLVTFSNYGSASVFETTDGGVNWTDKEDNLPDMPVRWGLYNPNNRSQVMLATEMGVWSTDDITAANPAWEPTNSGLANVRCDMLKYRAADGTVVVATWGRGVFTTNIFANQTHADFSASQNVTYLGMSVDFKDASLLPNSSWTWDFGDGNTSTEQNPSHTYAATGTYDVTLTIDGGAATETKTGYVSIMPVKTTPYTPADGGDFETNADDYVSKALRGGINHWERGTPANRLTTVTSGTNVWKTDLDADIQDLGFNYASALYTPAFDLSNTNKIYTLKFSKSMENGYSNTPHGLQVQYSIDGGKSWVTLGNSAPTFGAVNWYNRGSHIGSLINNRVFADETGWNGPSLTVSGNVIDNTVDNENTEFQLKGLSGQSHVMFRFVSAVQTGTTDDDNGSVYARDGFMIDDVQIFLSDPGAGFEANKTVSYANKDIQFTYLETGASAFSWDFGDGNTSTEQDPIHSYAAGGTYTVALTITGPSGDITETKTDYIQILGKQTIPYTAADGGNFDVNQDHFAAENIRGTAFELGNSSVTGKDGTASGDFAWVTGLTETVHQDNSEARLITSTYDFQTTGTYTLSFKAKYDFEDTWDGFIVEYSTNLGDSWTKLNNSVETGWYTTISDPQSVFGASVPMFSGDTGGSFTTFNTDVSFLFPNTEVVFRFLFLSDANTVEAGVAIDDFELDGPAPGPAVPDFTFTGVTGCEGQVVTFTNTSSGTISSLAWDFGAGAIPATATGAGPHNVLYSGTPGSSTVSLTVESPVNGTVVETKTDAISFAASHTPTFTAESSELYVTVLTASTGDSYQWYLNGEAITTDGTSQTYNATEAGNYHVEVNIGGCTKASNNQAVVITSFEDDVFGREIAIFPNPSLGQVRISISNEYTGEIKYNVYNLLGSKVLSYGVLKTAQDSEVELNLSELGYGTYLFEIISEQAKTTKRVVIR